MKNKIAALVAAVAVTFGFVAVSAEPAHAKPVHSKVRPTLDSSWPY